MSGLHIGLLGGGMAGRVHLEALTRHPAVSKVSLAEADELTCRKLMADFSLHRCEADYRALLDDRSIDAVVICLPHDLHYPAGLAAAAAGRHILLEKPLANTLAEADGLLAAAQSAGVRLAVAFNERSLPVHRRIKDLLEMGTIGPPVLAVLSIAGSELERMQRPEHWKGSLGRAGGGVLGDSGAHLADLALWWFGLPQMVSAVLTRASVTAANKGEDTAAMLLQYPGLCVTLALTYAAPGQPWSEQRRIWGKHGALQATIEASDVLQLWVDGCLVPQVIAHDSQNWWRLSVQACLSELVDCLAQEKPFPVTTEDARQELALVRAGYHSAALGRPVSLAEVETASASA